MMDLVPRPKIKHVAMAEFPQHPATEMFPSGPAFVEDQFVGIGNMERLVIHLRLRQRELRRYPVGDRMFGEQRSNDAWLHRCATTRKHATRPFHQEMPFAVLA